MLVSCQYGGMEFECSKMFTSILTDGGLCCIFNGLHRKFMTKLEYKYSIELKYFDSLFIISKLLLRFRETIFHSALLYFDLRFTIFILTHKFDHIFATKSSRSEDFNDSDYMESMANDWTPETGFQSERLKLNKDSYPRPGVGMIDNHFLGHLTQIINKLQFTWND